MTDHREAKASAKAEKARAKAMRPWFKKKRFIIPLALVSLMVIASLASGGGEEDDKTDVSANASAESLDTTAAPAAPAGEARLFPGRPDAHKDDQERAIGQSAQLSGYTATVNRAAFTQSLSDFERDGYIDVAVTIANRDSKAQPYNYFDWKLQTPGGTVIDAGFSSKDDRLGSGDLVTGGSVSGHIYFEIGTAKGTYYVIYKPDPFDAARGIWKVDV